MSAHGHDVTDAGAETASTSRSWLARIRREGQRPIGLKWRSSVFFITLVVAVGVGVDVLTYTIVVPVIPFRLQQLEYTNISALTGYLLCAYSVGIFLCTFPVAYFFHLHPYRRQPLVAATFVLIASLIMFMLATPFWLMILARFIQGGASTVIWSVGFALICENVDQGNIGRQIGFAISGVSIGTCIAPPIGGALYAALGWYAPFVFCMVVSFVDLVGRLLVIEQKDIQMWEEITEKNRIATTSSSDSAATISADRRQEKQPETQHPTNGVDRLNGPPSHSRIAGSDEVNDPLSPTESVPEAKAKELSPFGVLRALLSSPRGCTALLLTCSFSLVIGALDTSLTLRVEEIWEKESWFVGLIYLAASAPTFVTSPIAGHIADKAGSQVLAFPSLILSLPFLPLLILKGSLAGFIVIFTLANVFLSLFMAPVGLELAMAAKSIPGVSEIHQFAAMNLAFSIASAVGSIAGGQIYGLQNGWEGCCWFCFASVALALGPAFMYTGDRPLLARLKGRKDEKGGEGNPNPITESEA